jgi:glycosyltransferase involved in cell wall biosynthesis
MSLIKVANIIEEGKMGGPQIRIINIACAIKDSVATTVIMPRDNSLDFIQRCVETNIHYKVLSISRLTKEFLVLLRYACLSFFEILNISYELKKNNYDLVHVSGGSWQFKGVLAAKIANKKIIWHLNDTYTPTIIKFIFSFLSYFPDAFIFASNRTRSYYNPYIISNKLNFTIHAPVDTSRFDPELKYNVEKSLEDKFEGKFVVGTTCNVSPVKDLKTLIKAASFFTNKYPDSVFVIVGTVFRRQQKYFRKLKDLCKELEVTNVEFIDHVVDIRPILSRLDVYVCCSFAESSPTSVWEALSMKKAVVATDVGDISQYIINGVNGYIVNVGDYKTIVDRLTRLAKSSNLRESFASQSRQTAIKHLDIKRSAELHLKAYNSVI